MFNIKASLFRSSHSKSIKFNDVSGQRASSQRASLKGLHTALLILTMALHGRSLLENADGTGSTLLDNAGAIILSIFS